MYMTGTDGVAVSSYAFDDFGRNIDPFTGKIKEASHKHAYTTDGNIIQPFAFTGYQEDELSGLKFAQARFYDANTGRFQSEDNVKGFIDNPFTLNHYGYCWGNPVGLVDRDGNLPTWGKVLVTVGIVAVAGVAVVATGGLAAGAIAGVAAGVSAGTVSATAGMVTTMAIGATGAAVAAGAMDAGYQGVQMTWGNQKHYDVAQTNGAITSGFVYGGLTASGVGLGGSVAAGGISAAGGNMVTQYQKTGTVDARQLATATGAGMLGAAAGYGLATMVNQRYGRVVNSNDNCSTEESKVLALPEPYGTNPWKDGTEIISMDAPDGCYVNMAMAPGQHMPGGWATFDDIPNVSYVRNELAVTPEFKSEVSNVQKFLIPRGVPIQVGTVGPQTYNGIQYSGEGNQVQILNYSDRAKLIPIGEPYNIY